MIRHDEVAHQQSTPGESVIAEAQVPNLADSLSPSGNSSKARIRRT
jgi:hypothetical protein